MPSSFKIIKEAVIKTEDAYFLQLPSLAEMKKNEMTNEEERTLEKVVAKAEEEKEKIIAAARKEAEEILKRAEDEGYKTGFSQGMEKARQEGEKIEEKARAFLASAFKERDRIVEESKEIITAIVLKAVESIVKSEAEQNQDFLSNVIEKLIKEVNTAPSYFIFTHPQKRKEVEDALLLMEIEKKIPLGAKISVLDDPALEKNDIRVESEEEVAEFSLELFLEKIGANLKVRLEKNG